MNGVSRSQDPAPELLAPAGGPAALRAAVANGADAVYLGLGAFNARRGAENFTLETIGDACRFAHLRDVRVYLTANVLIHDDEMEDALALVDAAWAQGIDAVIVQDLGLLRLLRTRLPDVRVHASTQLNAHNSATVRELAGLGVARVTLARETSLPEIEVLAHAAATEVESFVHGALCMCYSGQCLLSSLIGARSANRGMCAQPCRLAYELSDEAGRVLDTPGAHLLSPKDLAGITLLPELVRTGVAALKIEGRMKSPEYVALVTGVYRAALDRAVADPDAYEAREAEQAVLAEAFSRGFTSAYLEGTRGGTMMSYRRPNNRGIPVGRVVAVAGSRATLALDVPLESADTIEFWTARGRFAQRVGGLAFAGSEHPAAPAGERAEVSVSEPVRAGDRVFRVANAALLAAARRSFESTDLAHPVGLDFSVRVVQGEPLRVEVSDPKGRQGVALGENVESARTKSVTVEEIVEHVGRLGATPYEAVSWDVSLSPNVGIGFSALHAVRRAALADYERAVLLPWAGRSAAHVSARDRGAAVPGKTERPPSGARSRTRGRGRDRHPVVLVAHIDDMTLATTALSAGADYVHLPARAFAGAPHDTSLVPELPRIAHDREFESLLRTAGAASRVVAGNLGFLEALRSAPVTVEAHWSLNAFNARTVEALAGLGAQLVWLSPELSGVQVAQIAQSVHTTLGAAIYGRQEVMVTEQCVLAAEGECDRGCGSCERRSQPRFLRDRKGYRFPLKTDSMGRSHLYNAIPLDLSVALPKLVEAGVTAFRLDFVTETAEEVDRVTRAMRSSLEAALAGRPGEPVTTPATTGHFFRGVR